MADVANDTKKPTQEELLKAVADVLDEALVEYEKLSKGEGIDAAQAIDDMKGAGKAVIGDGGGQKPLMAKDDAPPADKDKKDKDEDEDDEKMMMTYKSLIAKMEKRGLMAKMDKDKMKKSETVSEAAPAPVAAAVAAPADHVESLRKNVDERFEGLTKALKEVAETVKKIASTPVRRGVTGVTALRKNEGSEQPSLKKGEVLGKLMELRKSGDARVDSLFINRVETGRLMKGDPEKLKALGILTE